MRYLLLRLKRFCGYITGFVFFVSGILKLMDPVGAGLVMDEYYRFLHLDFLSFSSKIMATFFALAETVIGTGLITGVWRRNIGLAAVIMQGFFTVLTMILLIFNPEMDCGCFGEAIPLTHRQTFVKNLLLMALLLIYYIPKKQLGETRPKKYVSFALVCTSVLAFTVFSWISIPLVDYTAYKPGADLQAATADADEMYESTFIYEKDGIQEEFTLGHLPDSTWTFTDTRTRLKEGHNDVPANLSFRSPATGEYADDIATEGAVMAVSVYNPEIPARTWKKIERFIKESDKAGFRTILLTTAAEKVPSVLSDITYIADYKTIITLNRSNGGATFFQNGELVRKWARAGYPDASALNDICSSDTTEVSIAHYSKGSLALQGFLLYVSAILLLL